MYILTSIDERISAGEQLGGGGVFAGEKRQGDRSVQGDSTPGRNRSTVTSSER